MILQTSVFLPVAETGQLAGFWIALVRMARRAFTYLSWVNLKSAESNELKKE